MEKILLDRNLFTLNFACENRKGKLLELSWSHISFLLIYTLIHRTQCQYIENNI